MSRKAVPEFEPRCAVIATLAFAFALLSPWAAAAPINLLYERVANSAGQEVALATFPSIAEVQTYSATTTQFSTVDVASTFSIHGATWDGAAYRVLYEREVDSGGQDIAIASFATLDDIVNYSATSTQFSTVDVAPTFDIGGMTYDGSLYHILFERNSNSSGNEVAIASFGSFADIITYSALSTQFSNVDVAGTFNIHGLTYDDGFFHLLFERETNGVSGQEIALATFSSIADIIAYSPISTQFSTVDVAGTFDVAALFADVDFSPGDPGMGNGDPGDIAMPGDPGGADPEDPDTGSRNPPGDPRVIIAEPSSVTLIGIGLMLVLLAARRKASAVN